MPPTGRLPAPQTRDEELAYYKALVELNELGAELREVENRIRELCRTPEIRKFLGSPKLAKTLHCTKHRAEQLLGIEPDANEVKESLHP